MAMEYFCAYHTYLKAVQNLSDAECGRLFKACLEYSMTGAALELAGNERFAFEFIKGDIDRAKAAYQRKCDVNRKNVQKRWEEADFSAENTEKPSKNDTNVYENIRSYTTEYERNKSKGEGEGKGKREGEGKRKSKTLSFSVENDCPASPDFSAVANAWNALGLNQLQKFKAGTKRYDMTKCRIRDYGLDEVLRAIDLVGQSDFLMGRKKDFMATYDWFIRPNNFEKVLSGNYADRSSSEESSNIFLQMLKEGAFDDE